MMSATPSPPEAAPGAAGPALSAFERADAMERIARIIEERRDELARTLTLDQGKPLQSGANDEVDDGEMRSMLTPLTSILLPDGGTPMNSP
jgi:Aldehyde dehydrogenase family